MTFIQNNCLQYTKPLPLGSALLWYFGSAALSVFARCVTKRTASCFKEELRGKNVRRSSERKTML